MNPVQCNVMCDDCGWSGTDILNPDLAWRNTPCGGCGSLNCRVSPCDKFYYRQFIPNDGVFGIIDKPSEGRSASFGRFGTRRELRAKRDAYLAKKEAKGEKVEILQDCM